VNGTPTGGGWFTFGLDEPGDTGKDDYIQADAVVCEILGRCNTRGEKGNVAGEESR
jgi:hypothetical protein